MAVPDTVDVNPVAPAGRVVVTVALALADVPEADEEAAGHCEADSRCQMWITRTGCAGGMVHTEQQREDNRTTA